MSILFHRSEVENAKASYTEHDNLDFYINAEGRALMMNSIRVEGELRINETGTTRNAITDEIFVDNVIGIHSVIDNCSVELGNIGLVEQFSEYSRYVKMTEIGQKDVNDYHSAKKMCELISPQESGTRALTVGFTNDNTSAVAGDARDIDFSFKPRVCLNKMSDDLSFSKSGQIKLSITLAKKSNVLYGKQCDGNESYSLSNVRVVYKTVEDSMNSVEMRTILNLKSNVNSQLSNTMSKVPAVIDGVSCCFLRQDKENVAVECASSMDVLPGISELQFLFQDSTSEYISYVIDKKSEMIDLFVESLKSSGHNQVNANHNTMNFGIGLSFPPVDLSNQKFNIQINSSNSSLSTSPYIIYQYFHSFVSV